jgi:hypothetical protein
MFYGGLLYVILAPLAVLGVVVLAILALSGRSDPDSRGDRPYVLYLSLVSYVALFTALFALVDLATIAMDGILGAGAEPHYPYIGPGSEPALDVDTELRIRNVLNAGALALASGAVLLFHQSRSRRLVHEQGFAGSSGARTFTAYLYAVAFTSMAVLLVAAALSVPALVRTVAPGLTALGDSTSEREAALSDLVPALVAGAGAGVIYAIHWRAANRLRHGEDL